MLSACGSGDRSTSDMDLSFLTGCVTPSGLSTIELASSSGVPSPYTASSPITPRCDAKLQISSLVTSPETNDDLLSATNHWRAVTNETKTLNETGNFINGSVQ